ncbi:MAG: amidohydrolase [Deltaproteobacteria bacterium]|nr:amidohydrolase [Deltaproteobacteria bacterium]
MLEDPRTALAFALTGVLVLACTPRERPPSGRVPAEERAMAEPADLILRGGTIHTLDPAHPSARAVAIKRGRVLAVGEDDAIVRAHGGPSTKVIDLQGRTVVPGLIDAHFHLFAVGEQGSIVDLIGTQSVAQVREKVAAAVKTARPGAWIIGRGWDQNDWSGSNAAFPTAADLDGATNDHPVLLERVDGHAVWVNSAALTAAKITKDTKDPTGGKVLRANGLPTGVFIDNASSLVYASVPPPTASELKARVLAGQKECLRFGLTEIHEMGVSQAELDVLRELDAAGELKLRIYAMVSGGADGFAALLGAGPTIPDRDTRARLTVRGVKLYLDGALGSRGAALLAPYLDDRKNSGLLVTDERTFEAQVQIAKDKGYQVATHAIGDRANRVALDVYQRVFGKDLPAARARVEHAQVVAPSDLPRFGALGVIASMQPTHATSDMPWAEQRVGPERIRGAYAWRTLLTSNATLAAGSDAPVEAVSPLLGLYAAMTRQDRQGSPPAGWQSDQRLSPIAALSIFTRGAAYASFREDRAGMIREGFDADLTVLDVDPLEGAARLLEANAELTVVGGEIAFDRRGTERATQ